MKKMLVNMTVAALITGMALPVSALAADDALMQKIEQLSKELEQLKNKVKQNEEKANKAAEEQKAPAQKTDAKEIADLKQKIAKVEEKSLGRWLTLGGSYQFRIDSMYGQTKTYSSAIDTMNNMVKGFTAPSGVAGTSIGGFTSPSATQFMMQGQAGVLFTPAQFNTLLYQYMPQAMAAALPGVMTAMGTGNFNLANTALTAQQQQILSTLNVKVMPTVMKMQVGSVPGLLAMLPPGTPATTTVGQVFSGLPLEQQRLAQQMLMQGFLGLTPTSALAIVPAYKPMNQTLMTNRASLDLHAKATEDVTVTMKLDMYKTFGSQEDTATTGNYFADRVGVFDGTLGYTPSSSLLNVDRAYATWSNILEQPVWFSVGRRPSTHGAPSNLRLNTPSPGSTGTPALLVDYAFDGMVLGYAPDIETLPGASAKLCYGRGFDSGINTPTNSIKDTDMMGISIIPIDTDPLRVWLQWNRGFNIFDYPQMQNTVFGNTAPSTNLGSIDWYGMGAMTNLKKVGPGNLNFFSDFGMSVAHPGGNVSNNAGFQGLMSGQFFAEDRDRADRVGWALYTGIRYDLPSRTKLGFEYNYGSKNWITFAPAADDMWTSKVGTRGSVFEPYIIQELDLKPISSYLSKAFFRVGYQYYDFVYTGSNNWVGAPKKISEIKSTDLMLLAPLSKAQNVYASFEVKF